MTFLEFVDKKTREAKKQLKVIARVLESQNIKVEDFTKDEEPYIFVHSTSNTSFKGIRVYRIGTNIAFRVQNEPKTHPYGKAYDFNIEDMYYDYLSDNMNEDKAGQKVMETIAEEIKDFFQKSEEAEKEMMDNEFGDDALGRVVVRSTGTDYATQIMTKV